MLPSSTSPRISSSASSTSINNSLSPGPILLNNATNNQQQLIANTITTQSVVSPSVPIDDFDIISFSEQELKEIEKSFSVGAMNAFGLKSTETEILNQIDHSSMIQVRAFLSSMEIELKNSNELNNKFDSFQSISQAFQEKEKSIANLVKDLKTISKSIDDINNKIHQQ
ncbi:hypothetical protein ABK040_013814 [Willaertia magna]